MGMQAVQHSALPFKAAGVLLAASPQCCSGGRSAGWANRQPPAHRCDAGPASTSWSTGGRPSKGTRGSCRSCSIVGACLQHASMVIEAMVGTDDGEWSGGGGGGAHLLHCIVDQTTNYPARACTRWAGGPTGAQARLCPFYSPPGAGWRAWGAPTVLFLLQARSRSFASGQCLLRPC